MSNASLVHITGADTCIVVASQAGNTNYVTAPDKVHTITVNQAATSTSTCGVDHFIYTGLGDDALLGQRHRFWRSQPVAEGVG